jgi:hypothetical protein
VPTHKIIPYHVRLHPRGSAGDEDYWDLTDLPSESSSFSDYPTIIDLFEEELEALRDQYHDDTENEKTLGVNGWIRAGDTDTESESEVTEQTSLAASVADGGSEAAEPTENTIEGLFSYGSYGEAADFRNTQDDTKTEMAKERHMSSERGFYFGLHIPSDNTDKAVLVLHRIGNKGLKRILNARLQARVGDIDTDAQLEITPIAPESVINDLLSADALKAFHIVKKGTPKTDHESESTTLGSRKDLKSTVRIDAGHGNRVSLSKESVKNDLREMVRNQEYPFAEIHGGDPDDFKAEVIDDDKPRKVSMKGKRVDMEQRINLEEVEVDPEIGHPTPAALGGKARGLINEVLEAYNDDRISENSMLN